MAIRRLKLGEGVRLKGSTNATTKEGEIRLDPTAMRFKAYVESSERVLVTEDQTQTLTNKTIDGITIDGDASGTAILDEDDMVSDSDTKLATQQSIKAYVDSQVASKDEASEIDYDNTSSGLTANNVQDAVDEVEARVDQNETDIAVNESDIADNTANITTNTANISEIDQNVDDLVTLSGVAENSTDLGTFTGSTISDNTTVKPALQELETAIEAGDSTKVDKVSPSTDNAIVRFDGITGDQQDSNVTIDDTDVVSGITQLNVDDITIDGDTVSNSSGDVVIQPNSANEVVLEESTYLKGTQRLQPTFNVSSGANVTLPEPTTQVIYLTSGTLESIDMIPRIKTSDTSNYKLTLINTTGNAITLNNETGATANDQITTGTGTNLTMEDDTSINLIYNSLNNKWQVIGGTGAGTSTGGDGFNYISGASSDAEGSIGDWTAYKNTAISNQIGSVYAPDDFGGTPSGNLSLTANTTDPLIEEGDFKLEKTANNVRGEGFYYAFTAEKAHLTLKMLFRMYADLSEFNDNDLSIWLVSSNDSFVADFNFISAANPEVLVSKIVTKQFQLDASDTEYRLCIHMQTNDTDAKDAYFDGIFLGPKEVATGYFGTDLTSFTPTGTHTTNTTYSGFYKRDGDTISGEVFVEYSGQPNNTDLEITLPFEIDYSKISADSIKPLGHVRVNNNNVGDTIGILAPGSVDNFHVRPLIISFDSNADDNKLRSITNNWTGAGTDLAIAAGDDVSITFHNIPIQGWSSNAVSSEDYGSREIVVEGAGNGGTSITASVTDIDFTETRDTTSSWNGNQLTAPESGDYAISGNCFFTTDAERALSVFVDGSSVKLVSDGSTGGGSTIDNNSLQFSFSIYLNKGEVLSLRLTTGSGTLSNNTSNHHIHIAKLASPQTILETETVAARYTTNAGQSLTGSLSNIVYEDLVNDSHNSYNTSTGEYTIPTSGTYSITAKYTTTSSYTPSVENAILTIHVNVDGTNVDSASPRTGSTATSGYYSNIKTSLELSKGQVVAIKANSTDSTSLSTVSAQNTFSIERIK